MKSQTQSFNKLYLFSWEYFKISRCLSVSHHDKMTVANVSIEVENWKSVTWPSNRLKLTSPFQSTIKKSAQIRWREDNKNAEPYQSILGPRLAAQIREPRFLGPFLPPSLTSRSENSITKARQIQTKCSGKESLLLFAQFPTWPDPFGLACVCSAVQLRACLFGFWNIRVFFNFLPHFSLSRSLTKKIDARAREEERRGGNEREGEREEEAHSCRGKAKSRKTSSSNRKASQSAKQSKRSSRGKEKSHSTQAHTHKPCNRLGRIRIRYSYRDQGEGWFGS